MARRPVKVLCCFAESWAFLFGWFQLVGNIGSLFRDAKSLGQLKTYTIETYHEEMLNRGFTTDQLTSQESQAAVSQEALVRAMVGTCIAIDLFGVALALVLLYGITKQKAELIFIWIITECIFTLLWVLAMFAFIYIQEREVIQYFLAGLLCMGMVTQVFFLFVVDLHRRELEEMRVPAIAMRTV